MARSLTPIGDLDLHLFGEGTHRRLWELLGPQPMHVGADGVAMGVRFAVWAPQASAVSVVGDWNGWEPQRLSRVSEPSGIWVLAVPAARSGHRYEFEVIAADGSCVRRADPMARRSECPPSSASVVPAAGRHVWGDADWLETRVDVVAGRASMRIYEVHLASWRAGVDRWDELTDQLSEHVGAMGFTHVELMEASERPSGGSKEFRVAGSYAPPAGFGEPDGFRCFVDTLHRRNIGVILHWAPTHLLRDEWNLGRFDGAPLYERADPGTFAFDVGRREVRNFLVANALYWLEEFHVDGLRIDAVSSMDAVAFIRQTTAVVAEEFPDALMIAGGSTTWPAVTHPESTDALGCNRVWNRGWIRDTLQYLSLDPLLRSRHHHEMTCATLDAGGVRVVLPLGHDAALHGGASVLAGFGGDDWTRFATLRTLLAWQWAMPGAPLVFMGSELAMWDEWDADSTLPWHLLDHDPHRGVHDLIARLNTVADDRPALWRRDDEPDGVQWLDADDAERSLYSFVRWDVAGASAVVCVANFTPVPRTLRAGVPWGGDWTVVLDTDARRWWGSGHRADDPTVVGVDEACNGCSSSVLLDVGPLSMLYLAARSPG